MIQLEGITKSFGTLQVLKGIDLEIGKGEVVSIVGPSGAGKTTLLQIMGTLDKPDGGRIILYGGKPSERKGAFCLPESGNRFCFSVSPVVARVYGARECHDAVFDSR